MKIATFNANSLRKRIGIVLGWLTDHQPDILCIQETKVQDHEFPLEALQASGYQIAFRGMKSYNGVALFSKEKPKHVSFGIDDGDEPDEARLLRADFKNFSVVNTYIPQGYLIDSPKYAYKLKWYGRLKKYFQRHFSPTDSVLWCGDMNVAPDHIDVHAPEKHLLHVCFHEDVKKAYADTLSWGFSDIYRKHNPTKQQFTFWDYRYPSSLAANKGWRIDHILATQPLAEKSHDVGVDILPRMASSPSDHTFLWADLQITT